MGEKTIILENEAKKNEVQNTGENESSPLFSVDMLQMINDSQKQNGLQNTNFQPNHSKWNIKKASSKWFQTSVSFNFILSHADQWKWTQHTIGIESKLFEIVSGSIEILSCRKCIWIHTM